MIAVMDENPAYCPKCGREIYFSTLNYSDWQAHCAFWCQWCGLAYQLAETDLIIDVAHQSGGDLSD